MCAVTFLSVNARANVILPTRPQYISKVIISLEAFVSSLVIPVDIPTVHIAEYTSKSTSLMGAPFCR